MKTLTDANIIAPASEGGFHIELPGGTNFVITPELATEFLLSPYLKEAYEMGLEEHCGLVNFSHELLEYISNSDAPKSRPDGTLDKDRNSDNR